jgi:hypothetical protein
VSDVLRVSDVFWRGRAEALYQWMASRNFEGYDPFDAASAPWVRPLLGSRWGTVAWIQLHRRLPVQLRPLCGVPRHVNPKTLALVLEGLQALQAPGLDPVARALLSLQGRDGGWGYPFPWANRHFRVPAGTSASVPTAFAVHALLSAAQGGEVSDEVRVEAQGAAIRAARFLAEDLNEIPAPGGALLSYTPLDRRGVHNASLLSASVLGRVARLTGDGIGVPRAHAALSATVAAFPAPFPAPLWPYGLTRRDAWVDSYHTGYILNALTHLARDLGPDLSAEACSALAALQGEAFERWRGHFLEGSGAVRYRPGRAYPVEAHGAAQAILTLLQFRHLAPDAVAQAEQVGHWVESYLALRSGAYALEQGRFMRNPVPYMRWVQAWVFRALAELARVVGQERHP